jgi:putative transposase
MIVLSHKIRLNPTVKQDKYFRQASGISRFAYNWGLAEWKRQYKAGLKPTALAVKKAFNAIKPIEFPWVFLT